MLNIIKLTKNSCPPCVRLSHMLDEAQLDLIGIEVKEINISNQPEAIDQYNLTGVPVLVFEKDGVEVDRLDGFITGEDIVGVLEKHKGA